jgi:tetratricopeptide (TPR) repeat protein
MMRYFILFTAFTALTWAQDAPAKNWKDRAEYDLYEAATKATDGNKALEALNQWKQKYPETDYKEERAGLVMMTYQKLNQGDNMLKAAQEWHELNPKQIPPVYWGTLLTISLNNTAPDRLAFGEKAANALLANAESLTPDKKPAGVSDADWNKQRVMLQSTALKTLGWIEMQRKNNSAAEEVFTRFLKVNQNSGLISSWLANVMLAQKVPEKQIPALYHFARAGWYTGEDELPAELKKQVQGYFERNYKNFHGSEEGMKDVISLALKTPFPPEDFKIESAIEIAIRQENELKATNPQLAVWLGMKKSLLGPEGMEFFGAMKGAAIPEKMKGKVIAQTPARRPKEITLALSTDTGEEIKLILDEPFAYPAEPGTEIEFVNGVAQNFSNDPFMLTFEIDKEHVSGWPPPPRPAAKGAGKAKAKAK